MELAPLVRAFEVLLSPLEWGSREAWLEECRRRVREACDCDCPAEPGEPVDELERLLRLPDDEPGWLRAALASDAPEPACAPLPASTGIPETCLPALSLRCALAAGLATLDRLGAWRTTLAQAFDDVDTGMAIFGTGGLREVTRNACWTEVLREEPERDRLVQAIARQAAQAGAAGNCLVESDREVTLAGGTYRVSASRAASGTLLPESAVLVLLDRLSGGLPTTRELRVSFGLKGREPQIALLAAEGLTNAAIAERLQLSAHTVRHYLERVLDRLGLHSRAALARHIIDQSGRR